jgi:DNA-directed RNA polymerase subunit RPC12/RpoP
MKTRFDLSFADPKKRVCIECGKNLSLLEGYRHPTLGDAYLLCHECFVKVMVSVERWGRFVLWNSFNPESPDPTYIDNFPFPEEDKTIKHKKIVRR